MGMSGAGSVFSELCLQVLGILDVVSDSSREAQEILFWSHGSRLAIPYYAGDSCRFHAIEQRETLAAHRELPGYARYARHEECRG